MNCSAVITLERFRCPCGSDDACNCPPVDVEFHVVGVVDDLGEDLNPEVMGVAEVVSGDVVGLEGRELARAEDALCDEYLRLERLEKEAQQQKREGSLPFVTH